MRRGVVTVPLGRIPLPFRSDQHLDTDQARIRHDRGLLNAAYPMGSHGTDGRLGEVKSSCDCLEAVMDSSNASSP